MSPAANAKPVVLAVGDAVFGGSDAGGRAGVADGEAVVSDGEAGGLGVTSVGAQAAMRIAIATTVGARLRGPGLWNNGRLRRECDGFVSGPSSSVVGRLSHERLSARCRYAPENSHP